MVCDLRQGAKSLFKAHERRDRRIARPRAQAWQVFVVYYIRTGTRSSPCSSRFPGKFLRKE